MQTTSKQHKLLHIATLSERTQDKRCLFWGQAVFLLHSFSSGAVPFLQIAFYFNDLFLSAWICHRCTSPLPHVSTFTAGCRTEWDGLCVRTWYSVHINAHCVLRPDWLIQRYLVLNKYVTKAKSAVNCLFCLPPQLPEQPAPTAQNIGGTTELLVQIHLFMPGSTCLCNWWSNRLNKAHFHRNP